MDDFSAVRIGQALRNVKDAACRAAVNVLDQALTALGETVGTMIEKLNTIDRGAQVNVIETVKVNGSALTPSGKEVDVQVPSYSPATQGDDGLMSAADKTKLDGVEEQANKTIVDNALSGSSENPVQNKKVKEAIDQTNGAMGIVENGDTAVHTIGKDAFVMWKGLLCTADAAIPAGSALASSGAGKNLTAVPNGGLNALNRPVTAMYYHFDNGAGSHTFTIANNARLLLISSDSSVNSQGMWFIRTTGAGAVGKKDVAAASDITFDTATANKLKITVAGYTWLKFEDLMGRDITEKVSV